MIDLINNEIANFIDSIESVDEDSMNKIRNRYASSITEDLKNGHYTSNICMVLASNLKLNPKELSTTLVEKLNGKKLVTMTGYMMRYMATFSKAREIIDTGVIGAPITFNAQMYVSQLFKTGRGWRYDKEKSGGGVINTQATHAIDLISWFFGYPNRLNASLLSPHSKHTEDFGHITFNWDNGLMGWLDSSWSVYNHRMLETTIRVHGHNGNLMVNDDTIKLFLAKSFTVLA